VALSGDPRDIYATDKALLELFPEQRAPARWILSCHANPEALLAGDFDACEPRFGFQGLPSRICWFGLGERDKAGLLFNDMVADGRVSAPIVIGRDHLDCGSVASPNRETEAMKDGTDAVSDWAFLNAMVNVAGGASWVSFHHGGGVGIGFSQHAGQVIVADGTEASATAGTRADERPDDGRLPARGRGVRSNARSSRSSSQGPRPIHSTTDPGRSAPLPRTSRTPGSSKSRPCGIRARCTPTGCTTTNRATSRISTVGRMTSTR
jgi:hypothetical protein